MLALVLGHPREHRVQCSERLPLEADALGGRREADGGVDGPHLGGLEAGVLIGSLEDAWLAETERAGETRRRGGKPARRRMIETGIEKNWLRSGVE